MVQPDFGTKRAMAMLRAPHRPSKWDGWPDIARYCDTVAAIPHIERYLFREVSTHPQLVRYPALGT